MSQPRIGELLVQAGVLRAEHLAAALELPREPGRRFGEVLVERGFVSEVQLTQALGQQLSVPWVSLGHVEFSPQLLALVSGATAARLGVIPIYVRRVRKQGDTLYIAMEDPTNDAAIAEVSQLTGLPTRAMIASGDDLRAALRLYYGEAVAAPLRAGASTPVPVPAPSAAKGLGKTPDADLVASAPLLDDDDLVADSEPPPSGHSMPVDVSALEDAHDPDHSSASEIAVPLVSASPGLRRSSPSAAIPPPRPEAPAPPPPESQTSADESPEVDTPPRKSPPMVSLTLLDGTTIQLPTPSPSSAPKLPSAPPSEASVADAETSVTTRDILRALRASALGREADFAGEGPRLEAVCGALLGILLKQGAFAEWEFAEEYRRIVARRDAK